MPVQPVANSLARFELQTGRATGGGGSGKSEASASTRERILDAAEALFAERGFAGTSVRDLATRVGLNPASLYNHFKSKQATYEAVLERGLQPIFEVLDALDPSDWAPERLDAATDALIEQLARRPQVPRILVREALDGGENLAAMSAQWLRPLYDRALETFRASRASGETGALSAWEDDDLPLLLLAFNHLILGHLAAAPMLREVLGEEPLSRASLDRQRRFLRKVVRLLIVGPAGTA